MQQSPLSQLHSSTLASGSQLPLNSIGASTVQLGKSMNLLSNAIDAFPSNNTNQCKEGWETLGNKKCYLIQSVPNAKKWGEAKSFCEEQETELFLPVSAKEEADL